MWVAIFAFVILLGLLAYLDTRKPKNYPPGPSWLPILGSALRVLEGRKRTGYLYEATAELARRYGPVVGLKIGKELLVVVYGLKSLKEFSMSDDLLGRPQGIFYEMRTWGKRLGILLSDGELWQEQRKFALRHLREFGFGRKSMSAMIEEETKIMVETMKETLAKQNGSSIYIMEDFFGIYILNTLWMMLAGIRYNPGDKDLKDLQSIVSELFANVDMVGAPFSHFPILRYLAPNMSGYNIYVKMHLHLWEFLNKELKRHIETFNPDEPRDFMDVYLQILNSAEKKGETFSQDQLMAFCLDMFEAGSETTSKTLSFCFLYLILYPDVQKKAQEEIDRIVGRERLPSLSDRPNMPYVESVVLEALRMFGGRAFTVPHRALRDTYLSGYFIPKNTMVIGNLNGAMMIPEAGFEEPEVFRPERYLKDGKVSVSEGHIPFGFGKRRCMGETLARANIFLFTATLLQNFNFSVPAGSPPKLEWIDGVTPGPKHYKALVQVRE